MKVCKICKCKFEPKRSTLEPTCDNYDCKVSYALIQVKKQSDKQAKEQKKVRESNKKEAKEKLKTLSDYEAEAKKSFQKYIRMRDAGKPCISCGNIPTDPCGGHFYAAGIYSGMIFNEDNCHLQCNAHCNKFLSGNPLEYRKGLIKRYGEAFVNNLDVLSNTLRKYKYTKFELIEKKKEYDLKIKQLNKK